MASQFIVMLHFSREHGAWLHLTGWESPPTARDAVAALRQIEQQTDEVVRERGEPRWTPFVLLAGTMASETAPHQVRVAWRLAPEWADRLLDRVEGRGADEAIEEALDEWTSRRDADGDDVPSLDLDDYRGVDLQDLADRAHPPAG
jgi:hypothetical protein